MSIIVGIAGSIVRNLGSIISSPPPSFTSPLDFFTGGQNGVWYDISDITTLFQDSAGTIPVVSDGDPVGLIQDKSGNGNDATQTVSASRPIYRASAGIYSLEFDGVDDYLDTGTAFNHENVTAITGINGEDYGRVLDNRGTGAPGSVAGWQIKSNDGVSTDWVFVDDADSTAASISGGVATNTDGVIYMQYSDSTNVASAAVDGAAFSTASEASGGSILTGIGGRIGASSNSANQLFEGRIFSIVVTDDIRTSQERSDIETYITDKFSNVFTPLDLFSGGQDGFWYDTSDLTKLFQDSAGTTAVASDGDPIGLIQDKSGNSNDADQTVSASRPTYRSANTTAEYDDVDDCLFVVEALAGGHSFTGLSDAISFSVKITPDNVNDTTSGPAAWVFANNLIMFREQVAGNTANVPIAFGFEGGSLKLGAANGGDDEEVSAVASFTNGQEYVVGFSISGDNWSIYVDGSLDSSGTFTTAAGDRSVGNTTVNMTLGCRTTDGGAAIDFFEGDMSDIVLTNTTLSAGDFSALGAL
jgi:hypothetical protein